MAMADRGDLLDRLVTALSHPGVNGAVAAPDVIDDLLLLGALDGKAVYGAMNPGGIAGASWELDDRFTAYDAPTIANMAFEGGKIRLRIDLEDAGVPSTLQACGTAVCELAKRELISLVEPSIAHRVDRRARRETTTEATIRAATIAAALGTTSAHTWLELPVVDEMERAAAATTLPVVLLDDDGVDQDRTFERWREALGLPTVVGLVIGPSLLYPPGDDVAATVDAVVRLLPGGVGPA